MATQTINSESLFAIAHSRLESIYQPEVDDGAAGIAHDAIVWSTAVDSLMLRDGLFLEDDGGNRYEAHNQIGDDKSFKIGFDLALKLGARIATDPLSHFDVADLIEQEETSFLEELKRARCENAERTNKGDSPAT